MSSSSSPNIDAVKAFRYPEVASSSHLPDVVNTWQEEDSCSGNVPTITEEELLMRVQQAREEGLRLGEERGRAALEQRLAKERARVDKLLELFQQQSMEYFGKVEAELVHLALAIAGKILHRESQVDRMLLAALVKIAVDNLQHSSVVTVRVNPSGFAEWQQYFTAHASNAVTIHVIEDATVEPDNCVLESELGTAEMGINAQLKEVERGFFDLLAQRPGQQ